MGTRGAFGFRVDGEDKVTYNNSDSYPGGLGHQVLESLRGMKEKMTPKELVEKARNIRLVSEDEPPSEADIQRYRKWADTTVGSKSLSEWYVLLRGLQGSPRDILEEGIMLDSHAFLRNSLSCEWAYIINLDDECLEVYRGFQSAPHDKGRYSTDPPYEGMVRTYWPVALRATYPLGNLPNAMDLAHLDT